MNFELKGVHYDLSEKTKEFIDHKLHRIDFAKEYIIDLLITVTKNKPGYSVESNINFQWGHSSHVGAESHELYEAIELMLDKLEHVVRKEKKKVREH
jgi:putative sigma-54 modulation protein